MAKNVLIVESPAKTKTLNKYLSKEFQVLASYGHVRDLIPKEGAVDPDHNFAMKYDLIDKNKKHVEKIEAAIKKADTLYLATDPDREGEAISWHLYELLNDKGLLKDKAVHRVVFNEITKKAVLGAIASPRELSQPLIDAQQARRALDYLVGFNLSPLLWKKIRRGLSAGRVQSPALRLIAEREAEIEAFKPREYWSIIANLAKAKKSFLAKLTHYKGKKFSQFSIENEKFAKEVKDAVETAAQGELVVSDLQKKARKRNPPAPFITSTLQQEAARKLGFSAQRTMRIAQQLYEGIDIGEGEIGLITYMRTDSVHLADEAITDLRDAITQFFGKDSLPSSPRAYKTKAKNAQEAHEAIRPTSAIRKPEAIQSFLSSDQFKLYSLIWKRALACQMIHATIDTVQCDLSAKDVAVFRANGSQIRIKGYMALYEEGQDDVKTEEGETKMLPALAVNEAVPVSAFNANQHFTEPPPRYSEASLVKTLEAHGIGRPSTYASIISTLLNREYVTLDKKRFFPTDVGRIVNKFLTEYFAQYVDYDFTAKLEDALDAVSRDEQKWQPLLKDFWQPFKTKVDDIEQNVSRKDVTQEQIDEQCPKCDKPLAIRLGKRGRFIGCTGYPDCDFTRNVDSDESTEPEIVPDRKCPKCESDLVIKSGRYGKFIGCSAYPDCKFIEPIEKPKDTEVTCPECKQGTILSRKSRRGRVFFSCSGYPKCKYAIWNEPLDEPCPKCKWPILTLKTTKRRGTEKVCPQKECDFVETVEGPEQT